MKQIAILNGKPFYATENTIDWFSLIRNLVDDLIRRGHLMEPLTDKDKVEYRDKNTIRGGSVYSWISGYDVKIWKYNEEEKDWLIYMKYSES